MSGIVPPRHRAPTLVMALATFLLVACGPGAPDRNTSSEPSAAASPARSADPVPTPSTEVESTCGQTAPASVPVNDVTLHSGGDVQLTAATLGKGPRGVVLLHQSDNGICGWLPYAGYLASRGFHVLLFDRRCTGQSSCPTGDAANRHADDVQTAVSALHRRGAQKVVLVGASLGGSVAIGACAVVKTDGCVALSPAIFDLTLGNGLTAARAITKVRTPLLIADAPDDGDSPISDVQALARRARPGVVQFVSLPTGAGHGWDTVNDPTDPTRRSAFDARLLRFLDSHLS